ncbi:MAG: BrnT family toxin [Anaerolineae bacterium]
MDFEWDDRKAAHNVAKHGVAFTDAITAFADPLAITYPDPDHSNEEDRFITIGRSAAERLLIISHADRGEVTRIISAREVTRKERRLYESGNYGSG